MIVLDTDVLSIVQQARGETYGRLANRLDAAGAGGARIAQTIRTYGLLRTAPI